jgi:hypothetical protein
VPTYVFIDTETGETIEWFMSVSDREALLETCGRYKPVPTSAAIVDPIRLGTTKPDNCFRERMSHIKEHHSRGITQSTIRER